MSTFIATFLAALVLVLTALLIMGIGWFIRGRTLKKGCGIDPNALPDDKCGNEKKCPLCDPKKK